MSARRKSNVSQTKRVRIYGIARIDHERSHTHAWQVTITRKGRTFTKHFSDGVHGGKGKSLKAATRYRDRIIRDNAPLSRHEYAQVKRKNNRSGVPGVCEVAKLRMREGEPYEEVWYWVASWTPEAGGKHKHKSFSVKKYGDKDAFRRAVAARRKGVAEMEPGAHINHPGQAKRRGKQGGHRR